MMAREEHLFEVLENLVRIKNECSCTIFSECGLSDMTVKQIAYLKAIDEQGEVTFSRLAEITRNSKPTQPTRAQPRAARSTSPGPRQGRQPGKAQQSE